MSAQLDAFVNLYETKVRYFLPMKTLVKSILLVMKRYLYFDGVLLLTPRM